MVSKVRGELPAHGGGLAEGRGKGSSAPRGATDIRDVALWDEAVLLQTGLSAPTGRTGGGDSPQGAALVQLP